MLRFLGLGGRLTAALRYFAYLRFVQRLVDRTDRPLSEDFVLRVAAVTRPDGDQTPE